jgi:hypothetical protein
LHGLGCGVWLHHHSMLFEEGPFLDEAIEKIEDKNNIIKNIFPMIAITQL